MIPAEAVEAAARVLDQYVPPSGPSDADWRAMLPAAREALEAAAPHMYREWLNTKQGEK